MDKKKIPLNAYLISVFLLLLILYICSFFSKPSKDSRKLIKTALINPKYTESISQIQISTKDNQLILQKNQDWWEITDFENPMVKLPADSKRINKMISELSAVIGVYKVSDKNKSENNFGFEDSFVSISFNSSGNSVSELIFGSTDFTQTKRFVKSSGSEIVYEMEDTVSSYLSTSIQNWSEPTIISQQVLGTIKPETIQRVFADTKLISNKDKNYASYLSKLLELRHGGINTGLLYTKEVPDYSLKLELGNKDNIYITVWESNSEGSYLVLIAYEDESTNTMNSYFSNISAWTFSKLKYE